MPTMRSLRLMKYCRLTRDIGYQTKRERDLPRFGVLDEVNSYSCLSDLDLSSKIGYNGAVDKLLLVNSSEARFLGFVYAGLC
jgi:hypothetical protein